MFPSTKTEFWTKMQIDLDKKLTNLFKLDNKRNCNLFRRISTMFPSMKTEFWTKLQIDLDKKLTNLFKLDNKRNCNLFREF